jgi:hypothetical protein
LPHAPARWVIGLHVGLRFYRGRALCREAAQAWTAGAQYVREDLSWAQVEVRQGRFDWRRADEVFTVAAQFGLTVLPILDDAPGWAGGGDGRLPTRVGSYGRFAARAAARYGPGGTFWRRHRSLPQRPAAVFELFNEPYWPPSAGGHADPAQYAHLVVAAAKGSRAANRRVRLLIEADTTYSPTSGAPRLDWVAGMYAAVPNLGAYFDAVAVHPYASGSPLAFTPGGDDRWQSRRLELIHAGLAARGDGAKHLWVTEIGWSTCHRTCISESRQASYLRDFFALRRTRWSRYVDAVIAYSLQDNRYVKDPREAAYGVVRTDGVRKPAWYAFKAAAAIAAGR